jgi:hypothetical protein
MAELDRLQAVGAAEGDKQIRRNMIPLNLRVRQQVALLGAWITGWILVSWTVIYYETTSFSQGRRLGEGC